MKLEEAFSGCKTKRGVLWSYDGVNKEASQQNEPFDWTKHLSGEKVQGLSPVDLETGEVNWLGLDVDLKKKPEEICGNIFSKIGTEYFLYRTMGGKWRVIQHLHEAIDVEEAQHNAKELEKRVEKIGYQCDKGHTLPQGYDLKEGKPGAWFYMPYHNEDTHCYSPGGLKLTKSQTEFRIKYKDHPIIVASIGMIGKGEEGSRRKAIFCTLLYKNHFDCDVSIEELNKNFQTPLDETQLQKDIQHSKESIERHNYNKEFYLKGEPGWIKGICGVKPFLHDKGFDAIIGTLSDNYVYVRSRKEFFETEGETFEFVDKDQINDWWLHTTPKGDLMAKKLLKEPSFNKTKSYLTHAGKKPGVIELKSGEVKGLDKGTYLNIYKPSDVVAKQGDVSKLNEYYDWALKKENWYTIKQCLAFMLNEGGEKIMWFIILHSQSQGLGKGLLAQIMQSMFGNRNVRTNVKFKQLISTHSTLVDGAQIMCLNEVSFNPSNTGERKEFSEEFKNLITEANLIVNPKFQKEVEIPNLCNFFVFSNSPKPLYLGEDDRRAFVVNMSATKEEAKRKLEDQGYKKEILKIIADPSAFKWHLENEIKYDREMFFQDAPMTEDKEEMIRKNRTEFQKIFHASYEQGTFPFGNTTLRNGTPEGFHYIYKGIMHTDTLNEYLMMSKKFQNKHVFFKRDDIEDELKALCTPWSEGKTTKQIPRGSTGKFMRVYCMEPQWTVKDKTILKMTLGELSKLWDLTTTPENIIKNLKELPNYEEPKFIPTTSCEYDEEPKHRRNFNEDAEDPDDTHYNSHCWACTTFDPETKKYLKTEIDSDECEKCTRCDYAYKCNKCGECACDKPNSKIKPKHNY